MMPIFQCLQANMCERWFVCARVGDYIYVYTYCMPRMSIIIFARNIESIIFVYLSDLNRVDKKNTISMTINDFPKVQLCWELAAALYLLAMIKAWMVGVSCWLNHHTHLTADL